MVENSTCSYTPLGSSPAFLCSQWSWPSLYSCFHDTKSFMNRVKTYILVVSCYLLNRSREFHFSSTHTLLGSRPAFLLSQWSQPSLHSCVCETKSSMNRVKTYQSESTCQSLVSIHVCSCFLRPINLYEYA